MEKLSLELTKILYMRFASTYGEKFVRHHPNDQFVQLWWEEWSEGMAGINPNHIKDGLSYCRLNLEWPPSIAEFRRICEQASGVPTILEAMQSAIRREFTHPIVSMAYERVGSWAIKNDKQELFQRKFQEAYTASLNVFRLSPDESWKQLEQFNEKLLLPEPPPKNPTQQERKSFSENLAAYRKKAEKEKANEPATTHPIWQKDTITRGHRNFDENINNERIKYLIGVPEFLANTLSSDDWYDRIRYLRELEGREAVKNNIPASGVPPLNKTSPRSFNGAKVVYNRWGD